MFTVASKSDEKFESSLGIELNGQSKPEAALNFALNNDCPLVLKEIFYKWNKLF